MPLWLLLATPVAIAVALARPVAPDASGSLLAVAVGLDDLAAGRGRHHTADLRKNEVPMLPKQATAAQGT
jgi:hypothetical protein